MGQRGPKPGQYRMRPVPAGSPLAAGKPGYGPGVPVRPKHLSKPARKVWDETVAAMEQAGTLSVVHGHLLAAYCTAVADLESLSAQIDREGLLVSVPVYERYGKQVGTRQMPHPGLRWRQDLLAEVKMLAAELGLTPSSTGWAGAAGVADPGRPPNRVLQLKARIEAARAAGPAAAG